MAGSVSKVTVKLNQFTHTYPDDVDVLLIGPGGQSVLLMSDVGGAVGVSGVTVTLDDAATKSLPNSTRISTGTYKPTNVGTGDTFAAPAPAGPYSALLSAFNGAAPNGGWSLYVVDDKANYQGTIAGGWTLTITTTITNASPVITAQPVSQSVAVGTDVSFNVIASGTLPLNYQWFFNGSRLADGGQYGGVSTQTLFITNALPINAGGYSVVVTNVVGSATSSLAMLAVSVPGSCALPPADLVGWWPGEGNANDVASTNNGLLQGGATAKAAGNVGLAFSFEGANNYVQIPNSAALRPTNLTIEAWVRFSSLDSAGNSLAGQQYVIFKQNTRSANFEGFALTKTRVSGRDYLDFQVSAANGQAVELTSATAVSIGVWYHVAGVRGSNFLQLYVNGQLERQATVGFAQDYGNYPLYFGTSGQAYWDRKFAGTLDEVSLYSRALSASEIAAIYAAGSAGKCKSVSGLTITLSPQSQTVVLGSNAIFTVTAAGAAPLSYQWLFNGTNLLADSGQFSGANSPVLTISGVQPANAGGYAVVVTNSAGAVTSAVATLTVAPSPVAPSITTQPAGQSVTAGANVVFNVAANGTAPLAYQWQKNGTGLNNGGNISGASTSALALASVQASDAGNYQVVVSNGGGAVTSQVAALTVNLPPVITTQPASQTAVAGANAAFSVVASGTPPLAYRWRFNGSNLTDGGQFSGSTSPGLSIANVQAANAGGYSVQVSNVAGVVTSQVAVLTLPGNCVLPPAGLVGWWPGDGNANDIVGARNGTLQGGAIATAPGFDGLAFSFDGTNSYVSIPDAPAFHPATLTVECWVRFRTYRTPGTSAYINQQYIVFKQNSQAYEFEGFALTKDHDPQGDVILWEVASPAHELVRIDSVNTVVTNVWYHLAGVRGSNYVQLYLNGHLEAQTNVNFPQDYGNLPLFFGTSGQSYYDRKLQGELDEVSLYNRALSGSEIAALYAAGAAGKCKPAGAAVLVAQSTAPAAPRILAPFAVNGNFRFTLAGQEGKACAIEYSSDLEHWFEAGQVTLVGGQAVVTEPINGPRRFYRARLLP